MTKDDIIPALIQACPSSRRRWDEHLDYWVDDDRGDYIDMAEFAHHVVESFAAPDFSEFLAFFELLEKMITEGSPDVVELATIGLIEDIQNIASHADHGRRVFEEWLGPASHLVWTRVEAAWEGVTSLADMVRKERNLRPSEFHPDVRHGQPSWDHQDASKDDMGATLTQSATHQRA